MSKRKKILFDLPILNHPDRNTLRVSVDYRMGGHNYFTGTNQARGLYIDVSPLHVGEHSTTYTGFSGICMHVVTQARFNAKSLREHQPTPEQLNRVINHVINKENLTVDTSLFKEYQK